MEKGEKVRFIWLDEWRGIALISMIIYHIIFQATVVGCADSSILYLPISLVFQTIAQVFFLFIAGISSYLSEHNIKRGIKILGCAVVVTVVTYIVMPENRIVFGILHFLGMCIVLYGFVGKKITNLPAVLMIFFNGILFFILHATKVGDEIYRFLMESETLHPLIESKMLTIFGLPYEGFVSSDYFSLFPWIFLFFAGVFFGKYIREHQERFLIQRKPISWLSYLGRHTLFIYMIHIPIIWGILYGIKFWFLS